VKLYVLPLAVKLLPGDGDAGKDKDIEHIVHARIWHIIQDFIYTNQTFLTPPKMLSYVKN
jgi:hypothetical protein